MKLDPTVMRTMHRQDYRVLSAIERGMRQHALVPSPVIATLSSLRYGGTHKILSSLLRDKLLSHDRSCGYDGYRLTPSGHDVLALHTLQARGIVAGLGDRIGTGKESDVYIATMPDGESGIVEGKRMALKFHRLGRTSFRDVRSKRDYHIQSNKGNRNTQPVVQAHSWLFLSQTSAQREYAFLHALYTNGYNTPEPIGTDRHVVAMGLVSGMPLYKMRLRSYSACQVKSIYDQGMDVAVRLARQGLVHCDLHEFNLLVDVSKTKKDNDKEQENDHILLGDGTVQPIVTVIDFPQMVSVKHPNAKELWERDVSCLWKFFVSKCKGRTDTEIDDFVLPFWDDFMDIVDTQEDMKKEDCAVTTTLTPFISEEDTSAKRLDKTLRASGFDARESSTSGNTKYIQLCYYQDAHRGVIERNLSLSLECKDDDETSITSQRKGVCEWEHDDKDSNSLDPEETLCNESQDCDDSRLSKTVEEKKNVPFIATNSFSTKLSMAREQREERARARVRQYMKDEKKRRGRHTMSRTSNRNKTFVKGKCVFQDLSL